MTISEQIENELRAHVIIGESPPYPLTLSGIATHFDVSMMPVRRAVETLVEQKFLNRGTNGRLSANPRRKSRNGAKSIDEIKAPPPVAPDKKITDHVIDLSLRGVDECLREEITAEQFGIGRTVLRRILNRLAGEGIIEHLPRRGWRVRPFNEKDMLDYIVVRENLELLALDLAHSALDPKCLKEMIEANSPDSAGRPQMDNRLHRHWIDRADNRYLREFFDQSGIYYDALFARAVLDSETIARRSGEHREILRALLKHDLAQAKKALSIHIRDQRKHVARLFAEIIESADSGVDSLTISK